VARPYDFYERQVRAAVRPLALHIARYRILDALGWWELRQHYTRAQIVEHGLAARSASYRHEGHFEELIGKRVEQTTRADLDAWIAALRVVRSESSEQ
jgi:hypothetical protein